MKSVTISDAVFKSVNCRSASSCFLWQHNTDQSSSFHLGMCESSQAQLCYIYASSNSKGVNFREKAARTDAIALPLTPRSFTLPVLVLSCSGINQSLCILKYKRLSEHHHTEGLALKPPARLQCATFHPILLNQISRVIVWAAVISLCTRNLNVRCVSFYSSFLSDCSHGDRCDDHHRPLNVCHCNQWICTRR